MRKELVAKLNEFYESVGIVPNESFNCPKMEQCNKQGIKLAQGMQCHIGSNFGEDKIKVLVVSLDCGAGGKASIDIRTQEVEKGDTNPHMRGTKSIISNILKYEENEALKHFAMTNSCKCTRADSKSTDQIPEFYYEQCAVYKINEIELINPDIIYLQGKRALIGLQFENIEGLKTPISDYLKNLVIGNKKYYAVQCIHPSARGRHAQRKKIFYNDILPQINNILRAKLN